MKFKVGDIVKGTSEGKYTYTNSDMTKGEIIAIDETRRDSIRVKILERIGRTSIGSEYWVEPEYFELVSGIKLAKKEEPKSEVHIYKKGDKVVPHSKTAPGYVREDISEKSGYEKAITKHQPFLYVTEVYNEPGREDYKWKGIGQQVLALGLRPDLGGDYFLASDVTPYVETVEEPAEKGTFKVGDRIKGTPRSKYGYTSEDMTEGEVIETQPRDSQGRDIRIKMLKHKSFSDPESHGAFWVDSRKFDLIKPEAEMPGIKLVKKTEGPRVLAVGDKVMVRKDLEVGPCGDNTVVTEMLPYRGKEVTISGISGTCITLSGIGWNWTREMFDLGPVEKPEPKVGDRVLIKKDLVSGREYGLDTFVSEMVSYCGKTLVIAEVRKVTDGVKYKLKLEDGKPVTCNWTIEMFEKVSEPVEQSTSTEKKDTAPKYKVGDKVKVIAASRGWAGVNKGEIGTINTVPKDNKGVYLLNVHGYSSWGAHESDLEPYIEETKKEGDSKLAPKFKKGDEVKLITPSPIHGIGRAKLGDVGVVAFVASTPDSRGRYDCTINFPKHPAWNGVDSEVELVKSAGITLKEKAEPASIKGKFPFKCSNGNSIIESRDGYKIGDRVVHTSKGKGTVKMILEGAGAECIGIEFDSNIYGHDFNSYGIDFGYIGKKGHCWFCYASDLSHEGVVAEGIKLSGKKEVAKGISLKKSVEPVDDYDYPEEEEFDEEDFGDEDTYFVEIGREESMDGIKLVERSTEATRPATTKAVLGGTKSERGGIMKAFEKLFGNVSIGKDTSGRLAITPLGMAVKNNEGKWVAYDGTALVDVMDVKFDIDAAFYRVPTAEVKAKDVIINQTGVPVIVAEATKEKISVINPYNGLKEEIVPSTNIMGMKFYVKVINLFGDAFGKMDLKKPESLLPFMLMADGGSDDMLPLLLMSGNAGKDMNAMLPFLLMGKGGDKSDILPFLLMGQGGDMNAMLPFLLLGEKGGKGDMFETMLLMNAIGGKGFNLFGGATKADEE